MLHRAFLPALALTLVVQAGTAAAQFSIAPIEAAGVPTYDDWNLFLPGDQPPAFEAEVADEPAERSARRHH